MFAKMSNVHPSSRHPAEWAMGQLAKDMLCGDYQGAGLRKYAARLNHTSNYYILCPYRYTALFMRGTELDAGV